MHVGIVELTHTLGVDQSYVVCANRSATHPHTQPHHNPTLSLSSLFPSLSLCVVKRLNGLKLRIIVNRKSMLSSETVEFSHLQASLQATRSQLYSHRTKHYSNVIMGAIASQITSFTTVYSTVYSDADQRKHQSPASLDFVRGIHRGPVNSPHKWPVTRKMFPFDDIIMIIAERLMTRSMISTDQLGLSILKGPSCAIKQISKIFTQWWGPEVPRWEWLPTIWLVQYISRIQIKMSLLPVFDVFFDLRLDKRLRKQWWGWWFETPSRPLYCHYNAYRNISQGLKAASYVFRIGNVQLLKIDWYLASPTVFIYRFEIYWRGFLGVQLIISHDQANWWLGVEQACVVCVTTMTT